MWLLGMELWPPASALRVCKWSPISLGLHFNLGVRRDSSCKILSCRSLCLLVLCPLIFFLCTMDLRRFEIVHKWSWPGDRYWENACFRFQYGSKFLKLLLYQREKIINQETFNITWLTHHIRVLKKQESLNCIPLSLSNALWLVEACDQLYKYNALNMIVTYGLRCVHVCSLVTYAPSVDVAPLMVMTPLSSLSLCLVLLEKHRVYCSSFQFLPNVILHHNPK